jgi:hypothetical protein
MNISESSITYRFGIGLGIQRDPLKDSHKKSRDEKMHGGK